MKSPRHWLFLFLALLTLVRFALIGSYNLSPDESYYYLWSQHPALSYYSKGPGVAMTILASTKIFGATEFGVRFFSPLLALGTSLIMFGFARRLYGESIAVWSALLLNCIPIFNVGALVMTIDPLSIFFWAAALWTFWLALEKSPRWTFWWPLTGLLIGLGFLAKYTNAMQLLSIVLLLALTRKLRIEFKRPGFYTLLVVFGICTLPPILWNQQHAWITMAHLRSRGGLDSRFAVHPSEFLEFLGAHFGVYSPLIFAGLMMTLWDARKLAVRHFKPRFLVFFAAPLLLMYFILSLKQAGEANWTAPAFVSLGILAVALWQEAARTVRWRAQFAFAALVIGLLMSLLTVNTDAVRMVGIPWAYDKDPGSRLRGWRTTALAVQDVREKFEREHGKPVFLIGNKYQTAASLAFYLPEKRAEGPGHPPVYIPESQNIENQFSFWPRYDEMTDLKDLARNFLDSPEATNAPETVKKSVADALQAMPNEGQQVDESARAEARQKLAAAIHAAMPKARLDEYYTEEGVNQFIGRDALYITDRGEEHAASAIERGFEKVEMIALLEIKRRGLPLREVRVFACHNYRSLPL